MLLKFFFRTKIENIFAGLTTVKSMIYTIKHMSSYSTIHIVETLCIEM